MYVRIRRTRPGSPDGITVQKYQQGTTEDMPPELARTFIEQGWAEALETYSGGNEKAEQGSPANKDMGSAPKNKAAGNGRRRG